MKDEKTNILRILLIMLLGIFIFSCKTEADREKEAIELGEAFNYVYGNYFYQGKNKNVSCKLTNWSYKDGAYEITMEASCLATVYVMFLYDRECLAKRTYELKYDSNNKLISFRKSGGNQCAVELEAMTAMGNALKTAYDIQSKLDEYEQKR